MEATQDYVGFSARFGAAIVDAILVTLIILPALYLIYGREIIDSDKLLLGPADFVISYVLPAIGTILFWLRKRATPGKMLIEAEIVDERTGTTISTGQAVLRYIFYFVSALPLFLGYIWVAFDPKKQAWHDKIAGTVVVKR